MLKQLKGVRLSVVASGCMRRSNSRSMGSRLAAAGQDGALAVADEQQSSSDDLPLLQQQAHAAISHRRHPLQTRILSAINESTKWTVSAAVFGVLLWQHNEYAAWAVVGAVISSFICKVLKHVVNEQRPEHARKSDPGMPSSHANSLNFLSMYAALSLNYHTRSHPTAVSLAVFTVFLGAFLTWLRVHLGYHTWPQVLVGAALGGSTAAAWFSIGTSAALPALQQSSIGVPALYTVTLLAMAAFGVKNVLSWAQERRHQQQLQEQQQTELLQLQQKLEQWQPQPEQQQQGEEQAAPVVVPVPAAAARSDSQSMR